MRVRAIFPHIPLLFTIAAVAVCGTLGAWQVQRLVWKEKLIADMTAARAEAPLTTLPDDISGLLYRRVEVPGEYLNEHNFHFVGRMKGDTVGFFIHAPFKMDDGRTILVNRGYAPKNTETRLPGRQTVSGILRPLRAKRYFSPENQPEKNVWFYEDLPALSQASGEKLLPLAVEATGEYKSGVFPIPNDGVIPIRNDHLGYAVTWFAMSLIALVMYGFWRRSAKP